MTKITTKHSLSAVRRALLIPEIVREILLWLQALPSRVQKPTNYWPGNAVHCALVNHFWSGIAIPIIWTRLPIGRHGGIFHLARIFETPALKNSPRKQVFANYIESASYVMYAAYLPVAWRPEKPYYGCLNDLSFSKLRTLTVNVFGMGTLYAPDYVHNARDGPPRSHFVTGNCPVLSRLILTGFPESKDVYEIPKRSQWITSLRILVSKTKALETLEILESISMKRDTIRFLVKDAENLKCVKYGDKTWRSESSKLSSEAIRDE